MVMIVVVAGVSQLLTGPLVKTSLASYAMLPSAREGPR